MARTTFQITLDILNQMPHWMNKSENSINYRMIVSIAEEMAAYSTEQDNLTLEIFLDTTTGANLDSFGKLFKLSRKSGESDTDFRGRIKAFWQQFTGGGTLESIKYGVSQLVGVDPEDITITEVLFNAADKYHYSNTQDKYFLRRPTAIDDSDFEIRGTAGAAPYTFVKGTDYNLEANQVIFGIGGTDPDNDTIFEVDYNYREDAKINLTVVVENLVDFNAIKTAVLEEVPKMKAAGIGVNYIWMPLVAESLNLTDTFTIVESGIFTIDVDLIDGPAVLG